jgi:hypothetical protein
MRKQAFMDSTCLVSHPCGVLLNRQRANLRHPMLTCQLTVQHLHVHPWIAVLLGRWRLSVRLRSVAKAELSKGPFIVLMAHACCRPEVLQGIQERGFADEARRIVILQGCCLNDGAVLRRLGVIFHGYEGLQEGPPAMFIFLGPFFDQSPPQPPPSTAEMKHAFSTLAAILAVFPIIQVCILHALRCSLTLTLTKPLFFLLCQVPRSLAAGQCFLTQGSEDARLRPAGECLLGCRLGVVTFALFSMSAFCQPAMACPLVGLCHTFCHRFATKLARLPRLQAKSKLIFVPGAGDAGDAGTLPQPPLLRAIAQPLLGMAADVVLASNPCRVQFYTKEIVVLARERIRLFQQHILLPPQGARILLEC